MNDRSGGVSGSSFRPWSNGFGGIVCGAWILPSSAVALREKAGQ
jgi:hypothetical protein